MGDNPKMQGQCHLPPHLKPHILGMSLTLGSCPTHQLCAHLHEKFEVTKENCKEKKKFGCGSKIAKITNMSNH
jgi:hypothetical protein